MPFEIIRNDIVNMRADAIVNTANPEPVIGTGCDAGIHAAAGPELLETRRAIGPIAVGDAVVTPAFGLKARFVFHTVGPVWIDGLHNEAALLRQCYDRCLALALEQGCGSIAFPLLSTGNYGFPKALALQVALDAFSHFLLEHELQIWLVVFHREAFVLSEKLFRSVESFIDEHYIEARTLDEYGTTGEPARRERLHCAMSLSCEDRLSEQALSPAAPPDLDALLKSTDAGFSETLLKLIDRSGKTDTEIYKKAMVDRKLFSKIRSNPHYRPSKSTALAFALALELDFDETQDFIRRAGYTLSHSSHFDLIVEFFIRQKNYNIIELDAMLFQYDQPTIGS